MSNMRVILEALCHCKPKTCWRIRGSCRTAATQAVTWSKECINQGFYSGVYVRQSIRPGNYQLNDVRFTTGDDRAIRRTCGFAAQPVRTS